MASVTSSIAAMPSTLLHQAARVVDRQDRCGFGAIFGHARAHRLFIVVGATLEFG